MSATARKTAPLPDDIRARKGGVPLVSLTAYTTPMAQLMDAHCDFVWWGIPSAWCCTVCPPRWA